MAENSFPFQGGCFLFASLNPAAGIMGFWGGANALAAMSSRQGGGGERSGWGLLPFALNRPAGILQQSIPGHSLGQVLVKCPKEAVWAWQRRKSIEGLKRKQARAPCKAAASRAVWQRKEKPACGGNSRNRFSLYVKEIGFTRAHDMWWGLGGGENPWMEQ